MKNTLFTLLICFTGLSSLKAQWVELIPSNGASLQKIDCIDGHTCVIAGIDNGFLRKTTDGGQNWVDASNGIGASEGFSDLQCLDANNWFVCGSLFYRTNDGGGSWTSSPPPVANYIGVIHFLTPLIGYGLDGTDLYKTTDGGQNWTVINTPATTTLSMVKIHFSSENIGYIAMNNTVTNLIRIYKTIDGGANWVQKFEELGTNYFKDLQFVSDNVGYTCGVNRYILKTIDAGETWNIVTNPNQGSGNYFGLDFINESNGYVVGGNGKIIKTTNGGASWIEENHMTYGFGDVAIGNLDTVYVASLADIVLINTQAGLTVSIKDLKTNATIGSIFPNPTSDKITIELNEISENMEFKLYDLLGNKVKTEILSNKTTEINKENLSNGTYLYKITQNNEILSTGKLSFN